MKQQKQQKIKAFVEETALCFCTTIPKKKSSALSEQYEKYPYQLLTSIKMHYIVFLSYGDKMQLKHLCNTDDWINMSMSVINVNKHIHDEK